uniref:Putative secreted protein n=1 Tax=Amblyomma tuberculatum TaxID=48802 RepID=A0A6M2E301_9ACAR
MVEVCCRVHHCPHLEILWKVLEVIFLVEALGVQHMPHAKNLQVTFQFLCHLGCRQAKPSRTLCFATLVLTLCLDAPQRLRIRWHGILFLKTGCEETSMHHHHHHHDPCSNFRSSCDVLYRPPDRHMVCCQL